MKWCLVLIMLFPSLALTKPRAPMVNKLHLTSIEQGTDSSAYTVQVDFTPLSDSNRVIFSLKIPQGFNLVEGFSYWEGHLDSGKPFKKLLKLSGPLGKEGKIELTASMDLDNLKSTTKAILNLGASQLSKPNNTPIETRLRRE